jgi:putative SOS response-associated peptidase YedK
MCGRAYETYTDEELYVRYLPKSPAVPLQIAPVYNLCPTQNSPVLRLASGERRFDLLRWQLVPATEPSFSSRLSTFNARSESIFASPLYRDLVVRQRCIVPLSGFYEWKRTGDSKRPFRIFLREEPIMSVAGIWEIWHRGLPDERHSFSILTTSANEFMSDIHNRMPVILSRSDEDAWLDPQYSEKRSLQTLLRACPSSWLQRIEVSSLVNSPKNNSPALLEPVESSGGATPYTPSLFEA